MAAAPRTGSGSVEEALAQLQYLEQIYAQQYEILNEQITTYTLAHEAVKRNIELLERSSQIQDSNVLLNTEGGTYVEAHIGKISTIMTYVGAGYMVDKSIEDAKAFLEDNEKNGQALLDRLVADKQKVEKELIDISYRAAALRQG